jgi:hypothetical protein
LNILLLSSNIPPLLNVENGHFYLPAVELFGQKAREYTFIFFSTKTLEMERQPVNYTIKPSFAYDHGFLLTFDGVSTSGKIRMWHLTTWHLTLSSVKLQQH